MKIQDWRVTFSQESDACDKNDLGQSLIVRSEDAGGGQYLVIETSRWAIDSVEDFSRQLAELVKRMGAAS
jgi:hypothetical protein